MTPRSEQETIISYDRELDEWHYMSDVPKHNRKWAPLVSESRKEFDENGNVTFLEGRIAGTVSISKKRTMTAENRAKAAARLKAFRDREE